MMILLGTMTLYKGWCLEPKFSSCHHKTRILFSVKGIKVYCIQLWSSPMPFWRWDWSQKLIDNWSQTAERQTSSSVQQWLLQTIRRKVTNMNLWMDVWRERMWKGLIASGSWSLHESWHLLNITPYKVRSESKFMCGPSLAAVSLSNHIARLCQRPALLSTMSVTWMLV